MASGHVMVRMTMASRIASRRADRFVILNTARRALHARTTPKARGRDPQVIEIMMPLALPRLEHQCMAMGAAPTVRVPT